MEIDKEMDDRRDKMDRIRERWRWRWRWMEMEMEMEMETKWIDGDKMDR